jgi:hypothetical protein
VRPFGYRSVLERVMVEDWEAKVGDWTSVVAAWKREFVVQVFPPATNELVDAAIKTMGPLPYDLLAVLFITNGLTSGWFSLLPLHDATDVKRTWDSLQRANDLKTTRFLDRDETLLSRFLVFAALDAGGCAVIDRADGSLWYEEQGELHQTNLSLKDFVTTCLREVKDL